MFHSAVAHATDDLFVNKWKFNHDKSKLVGQRLSIKNVGADEYEFNDGAMKRLIVTEVTAKLWGVRRDGPEKLGRGGSRAHVVEASCVRMKFSMEDIL
jgi:hypothetical protein